MTDLQNTGENISNEIITLKQKADNTLRVIPLAVLMTIFFISRVWPFDKRPWISAGMIASMTVYLSTFIYAYYSNILKIKKLKKQLHKL